jgi:hypothetical protein
VGTQSAARMPSASLIAAEILLCNRVVRGVTHPWREPDQLMVAFQQLSGLPDMLRQGTLTKHAEQI